LTYRGRVRRAFLVAIVLAACGRGDLVDEGRVAYTKYCRQCHGDAGDGNGPAALGMRPPPRDLTAPRFKMKFAFVANGKLPNDDDLAHVVRFGLDGTAMRAWDVSDGELTAIIAYVKTLSPRWQKEPPGAPMVPPPDPWTDAAAAIAEGKRVYHVEAGCATCHPSYATPAELLAWTDGKKSELRPDEHVSAGLKDSEYHVKLLPPDFLVQPIRAAHDDPADPGHALRDLWRTVALGVGGTAMPGFRDPADPTDRKVWALAHYIDSLRKTRL
jgi:mono/diheme cytochrome c family protein